MWKKKEVLFYSDDCNLIDKMQSWQQVFGLGVEHTALISALSKP